MASKCDEEKNSFTNQVVKDKIVFPLFFVKSNGFEFKRSIFDSFFFRDSKFSVIFKKSSTERTRLLYLLFYNPILRKAKKKTTKIERLNIKTIRFDKKKWKHNLVLHYLISK